MILYQKSKKLKPNYSEKISGDKISGNLARINIKSESNQPETEF